MGPRLSAAAFVRWLGAMNINVWIALAIGATPMLFPDGRLLTPRWRIALLLLALGVLLSSLGYAFRPGLLEPGMSDDVNPFGIEGATGVSKAVETLGTVLHGTGILLGAVSVILRFRRSQGKERLQMHWFTLVGVGAVVSIITVLVASALESPLGSWYEVIVVTGWFGMLITVLIGMPVAVGVAT